MMMNFEDKLGSTIDFFPAAPTAQLAQSHNPRFITFFLNFAAYYYFLISQGFGGADAPMLIYFDLKRFKSELLIQISV